MLASVTNAGVPGDGVVTQATNFVGEGIHLYGVPSIALSQDAKAVAFDSNAANLAPGAAIACPDPFQTTQQKPCMNVFVHDLGSGKTEWISRPAPDGGLAP
jgi:hypothetical protein